MNMNLREFVQAREFLQGSYEVSAQLKGQPQHLLTLYLPLNDEQGARQVPRLRVPDSLEEHDRGLVLCALIRAGVQHPGLRDESLADLHRVARQYQHVELFTDLNALTTGLLSHLVRSLGRRVGRVLISSSSIDVLHEYQALLRRADDGRAYRKRAEMARALRVLEEIRTTVPVHVHQLPPGSTRYFQRSNAQPPKGKEDQGSISIDEKTYISEDRQMIAAYWDYVSRGGPRLPIHLVTSDFSLAHVCSAERVPFLFARSPGEAWKAQPGLEPEPLWFDPFALVLRACLPHVVLWELCQVFGTLDVRKTNEPEGSPSHFSLVYDSHNHLPGRMGTMAICPPVSYSSPHAVSTAHSTQPATTSPSERPKGERKVKLSLRSLLEVLPVDAGQSVPLESFKQRDEDSRRLLRQVGELTGLWLVGEREVTAGTALPELLKALKVRDYLAVNRLFRRYPGYDRMLQAVETGEPFPNSKQGGALTGWAICLGAAYKRKDSSHRGLAAVSNEDFAQTVARLHGELSDEGASVSLPALMDRVCLELALSPIRFEALLELTLGQGALREYEAQRATVQEDIPEHPVLVAPTSESPESYWRMFTPGQGLRLRGTLMGALVRRPGEA